MRAFSVALAAGLVVACPACCGVGSNGSPVKFKGQVNLVIWDAAKHTEHFVRRASFESSGKSMGFIAPTPSVPELAEANEAVFGFLDNLYQGGRPASKADHVDEVEVVQEQDVAGYHAVTLKASDSTKLADWMTENGYETTPGVQKWTKFYIQKKWYLTAFKVNLKDGSGATGTVRMTFTTEKPFNPYYVPEDNLGGQAGLALYYMGGGEPRVTVGSSKDWKKAQWSQDMKPEEVRAVEGYLNLDKGSLPTTMHLTSFRDGDFPNEAGDDLYFHESSGFGAALFPVGAVLLVFGLGSRWWLRRGSGGTVGSSLQS